ncbi:hypothetical protein OOT00_14960 [Desulfobotulus sp. H1]|uniref:DNA-binding protein n=1 Tax=Desulfobotulus pelophilus TaxID=2823377 RepID=A0ABT3NCU4_9BACT|nr:hypothetical protein [Desulfobotulus pelophilus]MCW7755285.1 hypothetical protein [Desulfobotulus pelophilus]
MYLNRKEVAARLCVSPGTVTAMVRRGDLPQPIRWGPFTLRWPVSDIEEAERKALSERPFVPRQPRNPPGRPRKHSEKDHALH